MILVIDFGSQTCHLITRRLKEQGFDCLIVDSEIKTDEIKKRNPAGIIFSGGPSSVYEKGAPSVQKEILGLGIPILGICYGWQLIACLLGGKVSLGRKEYGPEVIKVKRNTGILEGVPETFKVWLSHGDTVTKLPMGFEIIGSTQSVKTAFCYHPLKNIFGVQFHPEVKHTTFGDQILKNFCQEVCHLTPVRKLISISEIVGEIKKQVGEDKVICAVSGGVDSTITAALISKAIGENLVPIHIDNGLMRLGTREEIEHIFGKIVQAKPIIIPAKGIFLKALKGVTDPERKRKIIGRLYIRLFEKEARKTSEVKYLAQGTIYSDVIESKGSKNASKIKSHHNVGGLPKKLGLKLIEPLRFFYKDQVREIGRKLGLPSELVSKQPFPGPGQAVRIMGEVTEERLEKQQQADKIVLEELEKAGYLKKVFQSFPVMTGAKSTAVKGDKRFYGEVVALRIYESADIMTADWSRIPYDLLQRISSRIVNEVPGISRVVYDITTKPPATMEWE